MSLVKRHPLITFFVLAYALSWTFEIPLVVLQGTSRARTGASTSMWTRPRQQPTRLQMCR